MVPINNDVRPDGRGSNVMLLAKADAAEAAEDTAAKAADQKTELDRKIADLCASIEATNWFGIQSGYAGRDQLYLELAPYLVERNNDRNEHYSDLLKKYYKVYNKNFDRISDRIAAIQIYQFVSGVSQGNPIFLAENASDKKLGQVELINSIDEIDEYYQYVARIRDAEAVLTKMGESSLESSGMDKNAKEGLLTDRIAKVKAAIQGLEDLAKKDKTEKKYQIKTGASNVKVEVEKKGKDHYNLLNAKMVLARLMYERRKEGEDTDNALTGIYNEIIKYTEDKDKLKAEIKYKAGTGNDEKEKDLKELIVGIRYIKNSARLGVASLAISSQNKEELLKAIKDIGGVIEGLKGLEVEIDAVPGYRKTEFTDKFIKTPSRSYDFYSAKAVLADLTVKYTSLFGETLDGKLTIANDSKAIFDMACNMYKDAVNPESVVFYGKFSKIFEARARLGRINAAISFDKLTAYYKKESRKEAVEESKKELHNLVVPNVPYGQYQYLQSLSMEITMRLMAAQGVDPEIVPLIDQILVKSKDVVVKETSADGKVNEKTVVIRLLDNITDPETRMDVAARIYLSKCRAVMMTVQNAPDAETKLDVLVKTNSEGNVNGGALSYLSIAGKCAEDYKKICASHGKPSNDMDKSFYADFYNTEANLKAQIAWVYKTLYEELEEAGSTDTTVIDKYKGLYKQYADEVPALYERSLEICRSDKNFSLYDKKVRPQILALEKANFEASKISLKEAKDESVVAARLNDLRTKYDALKVDTSVADAEQAKYLNSQLAKTKLGILAAQLFLLNNNNLTKTSREDAEKAVFEHDEEIRTDYQELRILEGLTSDLTPSEIFNVKQTMVGATTVMLRYDLSKAMLNLKDYFDKMKKTIEKDKNVFLTYDMASAFSLFVMQKGLDKEADYLIKNGFAKVKESVAGASEAWKDKTLKKVYVKIGDLYNWVKSKKGSNKAKESALKTARQYYAEARKCGDSSLYTEAKMIELDIRIATVKDIVRDFAPGKRAAETKIRIPVYQTSLNAFIDLQTRKSVNVLERGYGGGLDVKAKMMADQWKGVICLSMIDLVKYGGIDSASVQALTGVGLTKADGSPKKPADIATDLMIKANVHFKAAEDMYGALTISDVKKRELGVGVASVYDSKATGLAAIAVNIDTKKDLEGSEKAIADAKAAANEGIKKADSEGNTDAKSMLMFTRTDIDAWTIVTNEDNNAQKAAKMKNVTADYENDLKVMTDLKDIGDLKAVDYEGVPARNLLNYGDAAARGAYSVKGSDYNAKKGDPDFVKANEAINAIISIDTAEEVKDKLKSGEISMSADDKREEYDSACTIIAQFMADMEKAGAIEKVDPKKRMEAAEAAKKLNALIVKYSGAAGKTDISASALARKGDIILANLNELKDDNPIPVLQDSRTYFMSAMDILLGKDTALQSNRLSLILQEAESQSKKGILDQNIIQTICLLMESEVRLYGRENQNITDINMKQARWHSEFALMNRARNVILKYISDSFSVGVNKADYDNAETGIHNLGKILSDKILSSEGQNNRELYERLMKIVNMRASLIFAGREMEIPEAVTMVTQGIIIVNGAAKPDSDYYAADYIIRK